MIVKNINNLPKKATRDGYGEVLLSLAKKNKDIIVVSADLADSLRLKEFSKQLPKQFIEVGVAEQNMMGISAGLALSGKIPFASSFAVFSPGRNWDQLRVSVCYSNANVKIIGSHAGLSVGQDGATHQALEDIAITRCLPNLKIIAPADYIEAKKATKAIIKEKGPIYLRLTRPATPILTTNKTPFKIGKANILIKGKDLTIISSGPIIYEAILAAQELKKKNIHIEIINNHTIKPLDEKTIIQSIKKTKKLITLEDHQVMGGMGSSILELLSNKYPVKTKMMGINDTFGESGTTQELYEKYKLNYKYIIKEVLKILKK